MNYIELFAGCGGLSLGLESIGSRLVMANELSPMAAQTYAYNFLSEDFDENQFIPKYTKWLSSEFSLNDFNKRLRENPYNFPELNSNRQNCDLSKSESLDGKLLVANIVHLNEYLESNSSLVNNLKNAYGHGTLDLVSGGPPCQSFSMAGLRKKDCDKNSLPWEFAKFVEKVKPRFTILENVSGILRAFKEEGKQYFAWVEVAKAFSKIGYIPLCLHINAKYVGIPQNRPRFIMIGVRNDIFEELKLTFNQSELELFSSSETFYKLANKNFDTTKKMIHCHEANHSSDIQLFRDSFLSPLVSGPARHISVSEAIDDLRFQGRKTKKSKYLKSNAELLAHGQLVDRHKIQNHEERNNNELVQRRFRLYQVMQKIGNGLSKEVRDILRGKVDEISNEAWNLFSEYDYLLEEGDYKQFSSKEDFVSFLHRHQTKKQTQKALDPNNPSPAALSIPDDACHYHHNELRTLTVREMARIQSFPDTFIFKSKITTGGKMRRFEVPQYTQVGNAVPPLLGRALGLTIQNLIERLDNNI